MNAFRRALGNNTYEREEYRTGQRVKLNSNAVQQRLPPILWGISEARITPSPTSSKGSIPLYPHIDKLLGAGCPLERSKALDEALSFNQC